MFKGQNEDVRRLVSDPAVAFGGIWTQTGHPFTERLQGASAPEKTSIYCSPKAGDPNKSRVSNRPKFLGLTGLVKNCGPLFFLFQSNFKLP